MIDNKYYRPTIDEIYNSPDLYYTNNDDIENGVFLNPFYYRDKNTSFDLRENSGINNCVVKYLDKEDIEELGFKHDYERCIGYKALAFMLGRYELIYKYCDEDLMIRIRSLNPSNEKGLNSTIFKGIVKNKSELIKLLKMLNINA